jgi:surface antigen
MKKLLTSILVIFLCASLVGCENMSKQDVGTMTGAVAGGLIGSRFGGGSGNVLAIGAGAVAGALIGSAIGKNMDETDKLKMTKTFESNAVGQPAYWKNSHTGATYTVVPVKNVAYRGNPYCREYQSTATIGGKKEQV